jgi:hypothetical protein
MASSNRRKSRDRTGGLPTWRHGRLYTLKCTECHALLLSLWKGEGKWQATEVRGCNHNTREEVVRWRFTKRELRHQLGLNVYAPSGGPGPRQSRVLPAPAKASRGRSLARRAAPVSPELLNRLGRDRPLQARPGADSEAA